MARLTSTLTALALLTGVGLWAGLAIAAPQRATAPDSSDAARDHADAVEPAEFDPPPRNNRTKYSYRGYPSKGPRNRGVLSNTCDHFPCGTWPSYYDMPPPIRPRVFYGYEPHRNGWPGYRRGWYRWDW